MDALHVAELECGPVQSSLYLPNVSACAAGQFSKHVLRKHAATGESDPVADQLADDILTLLADGRYVFQLDNEFAAVKICFRLLARIPQLGCPGRYEFPFQNQPTLGATINEGDPQHAVFLTTVTRAMGVPNRKARKVMNFQSGVGRRWLLKVNVVQNTIEQRHFVRSGEATEYGQGQVVDYGENRGIHLCDLRRDRLRNSGAELGIRNIVRDRCRTFLGGHIALCD
jgi:hypothetical protein